MAVVDCVPEMLEGSTDVIFETVLEREGRVDLSEKEQEDMLEVFRSRIGEQFGGYCMVEAMFRQVADEVSNAGSHESLVREGSRIYYAVGTTTTTTTTP